MKTEVTPFDPAEYLGDEAAIAEFLNASAEMDDPAVLLGAIAVVVRARSMTELASQAGLGRESLYKAMAPGAHPRYETVFKLLKAMRVKVRFAPADAAKAIKVKTPRKPRAPSKVSV